MCCIILLSGLLGRAQLCKCQRSTAIPKCRQRKVETKEKKYVNAFIYYAITKNIFNLCGVLFCLVFILYMFVCLFVFLFYLFVFVVFCLSKVHKL